MTDEKRPDLHHSQGVMVSEVLAAAAEDCFGCRVGHPSDASTHTCRRKEMPPAAPDYGGETIEVSEETAAEAHERLRVLVLKMAQAELKQSELAEQLDAADRELKTYQENLVPELMAELGLEVIKTKGGIYVEMKDVLFAELPKDARQEKVFDWLKSTGNDGMIKRQIVIQYGRDSTAWADALVKLLETTELRTTDANGVETLSKVKDHATMQIEWTIHHQTMLAHLRAELRADPPRHVPLELFSGVQKKIAKIKKSGSR